MHESLFAHAAFAEGATVLKLALRPYSLGHEILLQKLGNPLATHTASSFEELDEETQRSKLFSACFICERTWKQNRKPVRFAGLTSYFRRHLDTAKEITKFRAYRELGMAGFPTTKMPRVTGVPFHYFGAPEEARLLLLAQRERLDQLCGVETVFDVPYAFASMVYLADAEAQGNLWIQNYHDWRQKESQRIYEEQHPESTLAVGDEAVQRAAEQWNKEHPDCPVPLIHPTKQQEN